MVMSTLEAPLLQLEFLVLLCQFTGRTEGRGGAVSQSSTPDVVPAADVGALEELQNPAGTAADSDTRMNHAITRDEGTAVFGVWRTLRVQVLVALFILCVGYAGAEPRENKGLGIVEAVKETIAPFSAISVHGQVLHVTVSATDGHTSGSLRLLSIYFLVVLSHFRLYEERLRERSGRVRSQTNKDEQKSGLKSTQSE